MEQSLTDCSKRQGGPVSREPPSYYKTLHIGASLKPFTAGAGPLHRAGDAGKIATRYPLKPQQSHLPVKTSGISSKAAVAPHDPMARHHDTHRVVPHGTPHGLRRYPGSTSQERQPADYCPIGDHTPTWNLLQQAPHGKSEGATLQPHKRHRPGIPAREIEVEPPPRLVKHR